MWLMGWTGGVWFGFGYGLALRPAVGHPPAEPALGYAVGTGFLGWDRPERTTVVTRNTSSRVDDVDVVRDPYSDVVHTYSDVVSHDAPK